MCAWNTLHLFFNSTRRWVPRSRCSPSCSYKTCYNVIYLNQLSTLKFAGNNNLVPKQSESVLMLNRPRTVRSFELCFLTHRSVELVHRRRDVVFLCDIDTLFDFIYATSVCTFIGAYEGRDLWSLFRPSYDNRACFLRRSPNNRSAEWWMIHGCIS